MSRPECGEGPTDSVLNFGSSSVPGAIPSALTSFRRGWSLIPTMKARQAIHVGALLLEFPEA